MHITRTDILRLYKNLMLYSKSVKHTDPVYFRRKIGTEFRNNKNCTKSEDIEFLYRKGEALLRRGAVFVRGSGPGGSAVNKNANCVVITHIPTGTVIKCHTSRCQEDNRKKARELLITKLDEIINGDESVTEQKKRLDEKKFKRAEYKKKKMAKLKSEWKKREGFE